jgi:hypothetical protein
VKNMVMTTLTIASASVFLVIDSNVILTAM